MQMPHCLLHAKAGVAWLSSNLYSTNIKQCNLMAIVVTHLSFAGSRLCPGWALPLFCSAVVLNTTPTASTSHKSLHQIDLQLPIYPSIYVSTFAEWCVHGHSFHFGGSLCTPCGGLLLIVDCPTICLYICPSSAMQYSTPSHSPSRRALATSLTPIASFNHKQQ